MKKLLLIIPLQLALIFPNILMTQINHNSLNRNSLNQTVNLNNTYDYGDNQAMFNWEDSTEIKSSYGYYTYDDLIVNETKNTKNGIIPDEIWGKIPNNSEIKIGITNKTNTYYTNKSFEENDIKGNNYEEFEEEWDFEQSIESPQNYYGIGFELTIPNVTLLQQEHFDDKYLYISQTYDEKDKIGNYQQVESYYDKNTNEYYLYYDNWSGMIQDDVYLNFLIVDNTAIGEYLTTQTWNEYFSKAYQLEITKEEINDFTNLEKDKVNTCNNSFGINYDDVEYKYYRNKTHSSKYSEDWSANDYTANFNVKWNSQTLFWKEYFYDWNNNLYFNAIYEIPILYNSNPIDVVGFTNNGKAQVGRNYAYDSNVDIKPEQDLEINLELYSDPTNSKNCYSWRTYPFILGYYKDESNNKQFIPITETNSGGSDSNLISLDQYLEHNHQEIQYEDEPNEIHFLLSNEEGANDWKNSSFKHNNLFATNEEEMNETILNNLVNTNNENIYEYPYDTSHSYDETYATGYQNAFLIPEWDNVNHPKTKGSFYYANLVWLVISLIVGFALLILILIPLVSKRKKQLKGRDKI